MSALTAFFHRRRRGGAAAIGLAALALVGGPLAATGGSSGARAQQASATPQTIAGAQGLKIEYQAGKAGFPVDPFVVSTQRPAARAEALAGKSTVMALVDQVPYSAKAHVTDRYGADIFESRIGPMEVGATYLMPYSDTVVFGADAFLAPIESDGFLLQLDAGMNNPPPFGILIKRQGAAPLGYLQGLPEEEFRKTVQAEVLGLSQADPLLSAGEASALEIRPMAPSAPGGAFRIALETDAQAPVQAVYIIFHAAKDVPIALDYAGFVRDRPAARLMKVHAIGADEEGGAVLELRDEKGDVTTDYPDSKGDFVFERPPGPLFSATFRTMNNIYYFPAGRWLAADQALDPTVIFRPDYLNPGGQVNNLEAWRRSIRRSRLQSLYTENYAPHTRAWWSGGANKLTRFFSQYFYNNIGFDDTDVLRQDSDQCRVGVYVGDSTPEARQVRLFERSETLLSEWLSLALQHCVIVHTLAAGKSIQSYEDILRLQHDVKPNFLIFGAAPEDFMDMTPEIQKHYYGYSEGESPNAAFKFDDQGRLVYLPPSPTWMDHVVKPNPILDSGAEIGAAFLLPEKDAPPEANAAWRVLEAIVKQYNRELPETMLVLDASYERARCAAQEGCAPRDIVSATSKSAVSGGPSVFYGRLRGLCAQVDAVCVAPAESDEESVFRRPMLYENDFHYTRFGNYWLAEKLARSLAGPLARQADKQPLKAAIAPATVH